MRATTLATVAAVVLASQSSAATMRVDVGKGGGLAFTPDNLKAAVGDILEFHFHSINHSVVMGDFANPCSPAKTGGFYSGFMPVSGSGEAEETFQVTVNSTDPIFFYCAQNTFEHCINGMSGVVNEDSSSKNTLSAYQSAAKNVKSASNPPMVFGGRLVSSSAATTTSAAAAASTSCVTTNSKSGNGVSYKRSDTCSSAGSVQASVGIVAAFALCMAILLS